MQALSHLPSQNDLSKSIVDISMEDDDKLANEIWTKDPLFENINRKPLRLSILNELPLQSPNKNLSTFWEETHHFNEENTKNTRKNSVISNISTIRKNTSISSPNNLFRFSYMEIDEKPNKNMVKQKDDVRIVEEEAIEEKIVVNVNNSFNIKNKLKKIPNEKEYFIIISSLICHFI